MSGKFGRRWRIIGLVLAASLAPGQGRGQGRAVHAPRKPTLAEARNRMVDDEIVGAGVKNPRVIEAMRNTPRHEFIPLNQRANAYYDMALPIGQGQTISPPFIVAYMTEALDPQPADTVLEIGTGSGYQAAVLSGLVHDVYTIEIVPQLGQTAAKTLERLHYRNVHAKVGDGYQGWPEHAPFDKIIVTCSPEKVPQPLVAQLKAGGRIVIPVGQRYQQTLYLLKKVHGQMQSESLLPTLFVPMTGKAEAQREVQPDPTHPAIHNGDFAEVAGEPPQPVRWHYLRQLEMAVGAADAPSGRNYAVFRNAEPGRSAQALQAFAIDGQTIHALEVSARVRARNVRPGQSVQQLPVIGVIFYDENRLTLGEKLLGPWRGTFDWQSEKKRIEVPARAREAIVRIGLFGAIGELAIGDVEVAAAGK
ncbi:MAG: protein-L-isoaspartate(D-aspartate) O-methyltransferase [Thermoguttaceae bacterium]|jgi:protein-L-isoaspartate(D-aspartate) O-methyltransferase